MLIHSIHIFVSLKKVIDLNYTIYTTVNNANTRATRCVQLCLIIWFSVHSTHTTGTVTGSVAAAGTPGFQRIPPAFPAIPTPISIPDTSAPGAISELTMS